jgi:hypothetical protein
MPKRTVDEAEEGAITEEHSPVLLPDQPRTQ